MEEEALYQKIKARLMKEAPALLRVLVIAPEIEVIVQSKVIELDAKTTKGRLGQLIGEGFFADPVSGHAAHKELQRLGVVCDKRTVYKTMDEFAALGIVTKEADGYKTAPGAQIRLRNA